MRPVPKQALALIKEFEGCKLMGYLCPAGIPTVGWGHTGPEVKVGVKVTQRQADLYLAEDAAVAARRLERKVGADAVAKLTDNQYAALVSFVFNLGTGDPKKPTWKIWGHVKAGNFDQVPAQMARFVNAGGKKLKGLVRRRNAEIALWSEDEPGSEAEDLPSSTTRNTPTPPTHVDPVPPQKSGTLIAGAVSACGAVSVAAKEVTDTVAPWAAQSPLVEQGVTTVAAIAAAAAVTALALSWLKKRADRS